MGNIRCRNCKYYEVLSNEEPCLSCCSHSEYVQATIRTNADRIRAMSDEELAGFLDEFDSVSGCDMCSVRGNCHTASNCIEGFLGWLKSEVKE